VPGGSPLFPIRAPHLQPAVVEPMNRPVRNVRCASGCRADTGVSGSGAARRRGTTLSGSGMRRRLIGIGPAPRCTAPLDCGWQPPVPHGTRCPATHVSWPICSQCSPSADRNAVIWSWFLPSLIQTGKGAGWVTGTSARLPALVRPRNESVPSALTSRRRICCALQRLAHHHTRPTCRSPQLDPDDRPQSHRRGLACRRSGSRLPPSPMYPRAAKVPAPSAQPALPDSFTAPRPQPPSPPRESALAMTSSASAKVTCATWEMQGDGDCCSR